jgi:hypothetical protein
MGSEFRKVAPRGTVTKAVLARFVSLPVVRSADEMCNNVHEQQPVRILP